MKEQAKAEMTNGVPEAKDAGEMIRFFLEGGNDARFEDSDEVAAMVLAWTQHLMPTDVAAALIDAAGFEFYNSPMGGRLIRRKI